MRLLVLILFIGLVSFTKRDKKPSDSVISGNWRGSYGNMEVINDLNITFNTNIYVSVSGNNISGNGSYQVMGDSAIIISCKLPGQNSRKIILKGALNKTKTFTEGEWEITGTSQKGSFYLQKFSCNTGSSY